ncbi:hypothetical protein [Leptospira fainei]|nr:hypothetical protein [Leptospira fainei]
MNVFLLFVFLCLICIDCRANVRTSFDELPPENEFKKGIPDGQTWNGSYAVVASEIWGDKLKKILSDPNNFSRPDFDRDHIQEGFSELERFGKRAFLITIRPKFGGREVTELGETGVRLGECDAIDKLEIPYTYVVFPESLFQTLERFPKNPSESYAMLVKPRKKARPYYEEETRRIIATFQKGCIVPGENKLDIQILGYELLLFRFIFRYDQ